MAMVHAPLLRPRSRFAKQSKIQDIIKFDPNSVILFVENSNECFASLQIQNLSIDKTFSYLVKASQRKHYKVKQPQGILNKGRTIIYFKIITNKTEERLKDRFRIEVNSMPDGRLLIARDYKIAIKHEQLQIKALLEKGKNEAGGGSTNMSMVNMSMPSKTNNSTSAVSKLQSSTSAMLKETGIKKRSIRKRTTLEKRKYQQTLKTHLIEEKNQEKRDEVNKLESKYVQILVDTGSKSFKIYIISFFVGLILGIIIKLWLFS